MADQRWIVKKESLGDIQYGFEGSTPFIRYATTEENIRINYRLNKRLDFGEQVPHKGFYLILKIYKNPPIWKPEITEWFADVLWKETFDEQFVKVTEQIRLKPLFNQYSTEYTILNYNNCSEKLKDALIEIEEVRLIDIVDPKGVELYKTYAIEWKVREIFEEEDFLALNIIR